MLPHFSGEPPSKRQRVAKNGGPETMAMCWEQTRSVQNTYPDGSASLSSSQFGQYSLTQPLAITTNPDQLHNQYQISPVAFDTSQNYGAPTNSYVPSVASSPSHASMAFTYQPRHPLPLAQTMSSMTSQASNISNLTPVNKQDILIDQIEATISHGNEISHDLVTAPPTVDPDETVCFGVVSRPQFLSTRAVMKCEDLRERIAKYQGIN